MEVTEILEKQIGTEENQVLKPKKVKIVNTTVKNKTKEGKDMKTPLLEINCKHPDNDELVTFTKIKLERNGQLMVVATWISLDSEDKIQKSSAIAQLMNFLGVQTLADVYGKEIDTVEQSGDNKYLCLKAY